MTKTQQRHRNMMQPAFTLMEILIAIAIIAVLASLTFGGMSYYGEKMKYSRTEVLIASIERALEDYKSDNGFYPQGDGGLGSSEQLYIALYGDGKLGNTAGVVSIVEAPDGDNTGATDGEAYLGTLNPTFKGKSSNVENQGGTYVIIDSWDNDVDNNDRNQLRYRHDPTDSLGAKNDMMNPVNDFDLWSKGSNGKGPPDETAQADIADDIKNW